MSQVTRVLTTAAVAVVLSVAVMLFVTRPASAQVGRTAECIGIGQLTNTVGWMNSQLKVGRTEFIEVNRVQLCAW